MILLCDTRTTAERWIDWLRETRGGRATFLPLDALNPYALNHEILLLAEGAPGYLGVAADLVSCDDSVMPALRMALGRTLVVKTLREATSLSDRISSRMPYCVSSGRCCAPFRFYDRRLYAD